MSEARLAIVGGGVTQNRAPFDDPGVVIWSTASVGLGLKRCEVIFELHDGVFKAEDLNKFGGKVFMRERHDDIPCSAAFPIDELVETFGKRFNGTVAMMLGFAHMCGFTNIELYGVDFSSDEEYSRRNMFYWLMGYLSALGDKITICPGGYMNDTCSTYMYELDDLEYIRDIRSRIKEQMRDDEKMLAALKGREQYAKGVFETLNLIERRN